MQEFIFILLPPIKPMYPSKIGKKRKLNERFGESLLMENVFMSLFMRFEKLKFSYFTISLIITYVPIRL